MIRSLFCEFDGHGRLDRAHGSAASLVTVDIEGLAVRLTWPATMGKIDAAVGADIDSLEHGPVSCRAQLERFGSPVIVRFVS